MKTQNPIIYESSRIPASFRAWCEKHSDKIARVDFGTGYSHPNDGRDCSSYNVLLRHGFRMDDDYVHTIIDPRQAAVFPSVCHCRNTQQGVTMQTPFFMQTNYTYSLWALCAKRYGVAYAARVANLNGVPLECCIGYLKRYTLEN